MPPAKRSTLRKADTKDTKGTKLKGTGKGGPLESPPASFRGAKGSTPRQAPASHRKNSALASAPVEGDLLSQAVASTALPIIEEPPAEAPAASPVAAPAGAVDSGGSSGVDVAELTRARDAAVSQLADADARHATELAERQRVIDDLRNLLEEARAPKVIAALEAPAPAPAAPAGPSPEELAKRDAELAVLRAQLERAEDQRRKAELAAAAVNPDEAVRLQAAYEEASERLAHAEQHEQVLQSKIDEHLGRLKDNLALHLKVRCMPG